MHNPATFEFYNNYVKVKYIDSGVSTVKFVDYAQVKNLFRDENRIDYVSPTFTAQIVKHAQSEANNRYFFLSCRKIGRLNFNVGSRSCSLQLPYLYFYWSFRKDSTHFTLYNTTLYASFEPPASNTKLYVPYVNNVSSSGVVCWGDSSRYTNVGQPNLDCISLFENLFFISEHNWDYVESDRIMDLSSLPDYQTRQEWLSTGLVYANTEKQLNNIFT